MPHRLQCLLFASLLPLALFAVGCSGDDSSTTEDSTATTDGANTPGSTGGDEVVSDVVPTPDPTADAGAGRTRDDAGGVTSDPVQDTAGPREEPRQAADVHRLLLTGLAEKVILPTYRDFHTQAVALEAAAAAHKASHSESDLDALQDAWRQAMTVWQYAEVLQVGPAGSMTTALGGEDRRSEIYSWPTVNACRVAQELTEDAHNDPEVFNSELVNVRGLDAMEYVLFGPVDTNECKAQSTINKEGIWQALIDAGELPARRAAYAHTVSVLLVQEAKALVDVWEADEAGFLAELSDAGGSSDVYASAQEALNAISDAMFYVEKQTKDMKLAHPAGISVCEEATCPDALESRWAHHSRENVLANVKALQWLFHGGPDADTDLGFDDVLTEMGASALATDFGTYLSMAVNALSSMDMSFVEALSSDPQAVIDIYDVVKGATDLLKTEFVGTLDLEIPNRAAGDND